MAATWQTRRCVPPILDDPRAATLSLAQRHSLVLLPLAVDDHGRALDDAGRLNGLLWGNLWREHGPQDMESDIAALAAAGFVTRYSVDGVSYLQVRDWDSTQVVSRRAPSKYPAPPGEAGATPGHNWGVYSGESGERVNAKVRAAVDSFVAQAQHAAERLQDPTVQANAADYLAKLAGQVDPAWGEKVRTRADQWIKTGPEGESTGTPADTPASAPAPPSPPSPPSPPVPPQADAPPAPPVPPIQQDDAPRD